MAETFEVVADCENMDYWGIELGGESQKRHNSSEKKIVEIYTSKKKSVVSPIDEPTLSLPFLSSSARLQNLES